MTLEPATVPGVALVGAGAISRSHAAAVSGNPGLRLAGVVDTDPDARARSATELGVPGYDSVEALLAAGAPDIACVCTPPATHRPLVEALLAGGVDVLCEKPLATTADDARAMLARAGDAGRRLAVSDKFRRVDDLREAGRRIAGGEIGAPLSFAVSFCAPVDVQGRWPADPALSGGGVVMDNAPHAFDVLSHALDAPIVACRGAFAAPRLAPPVEDTALITFRTAKGTVGRIELSWVYYAKDFDYLVVQGTEGTIGVAWTGARIRRHGEREWTNFGSGYSKTAAFAHMWRAFTAPGPSTEAWPDPVQALELIGSVYTTARDDGHAA